LTDRVLAGRYRLLSKLGEGGMGSVWRAEHLELNSIVAVKLIDPSIAAAPAALARFKQEAQAAASLRSPNVVQILDYGIDSSDFGATPFIAMECLEGESLSGRIARLGRLDPNSCQRIMSQVGRAVTKAHETGIVHRDLKPDNIFLAKDEDEEIAKVLDFGIAKRQQPGLHGTPGQMTQTGAVMGTPYYMSPEQAMARQVDPKTDIWSLAVITYECLVGKRPFDAENITLLVLAICKEAPPVPSAFGPVPPGFDAWFARGVAANPADRFSSVREMMTVLTRLCTAPGANVGDQTVLSAGTPGRAPELSVTPGVAEARTGPSVSGPAVSGPSVTSSNIQPSTNTLPEPVLPKKSYGGLIGVLLAAIAVGAVGMFLLFRMQAPAPEPETAVAPPPAAAPPAPTVVPVADTPAVVPAPASAIAPAPEASAAASASARPVVRPGRPPTRPPAPVAAPPAPAKPPVAAPVAPPAPAKPPAPAPAKPPAVADRLESEVGI
jgi:serine/threonine-protein kinase